MRTSIFCYFILLTQLCQAQNVKLEITDYLQKVDDKEYSTFQFVKSSYSASRATVIFITGRPVFLSLTEGIPQFFTGKQEYTDVWVLGITGFDQKNITDIDKKIISTFFNKIIKYRNDYDLPAYTLERLEENKIFICNKEEICKYISCKKRTLK